eukprot:5544668-Heterocapsa_arctica.AAC.1
MVGADLLSDLSQHTYEEGAGGLASYEARLERTYRLTCPSFPKVGEPGQGFKVQANINGLAAEAALTTHSESRFI